MRIVKIAFICLATTGMVGCASSPTGASWWLVDTNKYDKNYEPFRTNAIAIGKSKEEVVAVLGDKYSIVEAGEEYEVIAYQKWRAVQGPDYVEGTMYLRFSDNKLKNWKITRDTVEIVPRTW